jgi:putative peptide modification system cyclase
MDTAVQTYDPTPEPAPRTPGNAPQLRTLLLTDLVDSTGLVERLGDEPASELFRAHDRLVLQLQQLWRGRLIDRSDGLLLLFERPIDGLGFALDYARGLIDLGKARNLALRARAGLHVGEVLTWRNSDEAVSIGAKPLEVEGLAKPIAARLMAMARPGQILLSAVAEPLAHRAARELGERGQHLAWKSWGRWRFKGVPEPQQVFEVGEPGVAPLRMPPNTPKAWRDIPLWRRPAALAAEVALLAGAALGVWFIARPEPAIAFNQRDWVVVGDLRNLTGQSALDDSLEQAFRISLEQSRYVNVLSDLKARDTLQRMQRAPDTVLDRAVASEIALRDGARAVILPTVAEVGGRVRVSAEVIDPRTQTTVYAESAEGTGIGSALESIDDVTAALRGQLGEALKSVERDSKPLPQVTTKNLDALRAYALAERAYLHGEYRDAQQFYERATALDPEFALAWVGQMRVKYAQSDAPSAIAFLRRAQALRENLPARDALYLDAWAARFDTPGQATQKWEQLARLYPDYAQAQMNAAMWLFAENRYDAALAYAGKALDSRNALQGIAYDTIGRAQLGLGHYAEAGRAFDRAMADGYRSSLRRRVAVAAAARKFPEANALAAKLAVDDRYAAFERASLAVDQARWPDAARYADAALEQAESAGGFDSRNFPVPAATAAWIAGDPEPARAKAQLAVDRALAALADTRDPDAEDDAAVAMAASLLALRLGVDQPAKRTLSVLEQRPELVQAPNLAELQALLRAESLRTSGHPRDSIRLLRPFVNGHELYQTRSALLSAYVDAEDPAAALEQARWLQQHRGRAYAEQTCGYCIQLLNVADSNLAAVSEAEILVALGRRPEAEKVLESFDRRWPTEALPTHLRVRRARVSASSVGVL